MILEDYVSFETAKLLKEKGFDEDSPYFYDLKHPKSGYLSNKRYGEYIHNGKDYEGRELASCPTLQMAMKWLRENYNIHITAVPNGIGEDVFYMGIYRKYDYGWTYISDCLDEEYKEAEFHTPEEACEAGIKYCLENLI
jgi:hypothetical protein